MIDVTLDETLFSALHTAIIKIPTKNISHYQCSHLKYDLQDSTGISSSSAVYSVTQRSVLNSSNIGGGNIPSQLSVTDQQAHDQVLLNHATMTSYKSRCDQMWQFVTILAIFGTLWRFIFPKIAKKWRFGEDVLVFEKFIYLVWWQIWWFLTKCLRLFCLNTCTWSHCNKSGKIFNDIKEYFLRHHARGEG